MKGFLFSTKLTIAIILIVLMSTTLWNQTLPPANQTPTNIKTLNLEMMSVYFNEINPSEERLNQTCSEVTYYDSLTSYTYGKIYFKTKTICEGK